MIEIKQDRMVVAVSGADELTLAPALTYQHQSMVREWVLDSKTGRRSMVEKTDFETRKLYTVLDSGVIVCQHGLIERLCAHLDSLKIEYTFEDLSNVDCSPDYENLKKRMPDFKFRPNQDIAVSIVCSLNCGQIVAPAAFGKCFGFDTEIMMYDGTSKYIQDIVDGDLVMGEDSEPKVVTGCTSGSSEMFEIVPNYLGKPWICNREHILHLKASCSDGSVKKGDLINISVNDYINKSNNFKHLYKMRRAEVDFPEKDQPYDPYVYGAWLGDGHHGAVTFTINDKDTSLSGYLDSWAASVGLCKGASAKSGASTTQSYVKNVGQGSTKPGGNPVRQWFIKLRKEDGIRPEYLYGSRQQRLELLAGLIDTDGYTNNGKGISIMLKPKKLSEDIAFLATSLGMPAVCSKAVKTCTNTGAVGTYWRVGLRGDTSVIPLKVPHKRCRHSITRNPLHHGFVVKPIGLGNYYGFTLEGESSLFLLKDCTVVHNTECIKAICALYPDKDIVVVTPGAQLARDTQKRIQDVFTDEHVGLLGAGGKTLGRVTVSTYQSLKKYPPTRPQIVLVDESHRSASPLLAESLSRFTKVEKMFGFTASPKGRSDGAELVTESLMGPVRFEVGYVEAMNKGLVAPMRVLLADVTSGPDEKNFKSAVTRQRNLLWKNVLRNKLIANAVQEYTKDGNVLGLEDPQVLILVGTSVHLEQLSKLLPDYSLIYKSTGNTGLPKLKQREIDSLFDQFQSRDLKKVIATGCWGIGVDFPDLDLVVMASGKSGPIDVIQYTGRGTRLGTGAKEFGYVLDLKDQWSYWARAKANKRIRLYKEMGWTIIEN